MTVALPVPSTDPLDTAPGDTEAPPPAPVALLERLAEVAGMARGRRRLVLLLSQLGDFDSLEYAQALVPVLPRLEADDTLLYSHRDRGILGFSATMARPLSFLDPYLT